MAVSHFDANIKCHRSNPWIEAEVDEWMRERITAIRSDAE